MKFNVENVVPTDMNVLIQPGPVKKIKTLQINPASGKVQDVNGSKIEDVDRTYEKLPTKFRIGQVIATPAMVEGKELPYKKGDWVTYIDSNAAIKFDLLARKSDDDKCPVLVKTFNVLAKIDTNNE